MAHWLNSYIGKPYQLGTSGPDTFDCWGFVRWVLTHHYGHANAAFDVLSALCNSSPSSSWRALPCPFDGAVVMMEAAHCPHVGVWVETDHDGIAHCIEKYGVIFTPLSTLPLLGCRFIAFYGFSEISQ